jgi:hypothetical protein
MAAIGGRQQCAWLAVAFCAAFSAAARADDCPVVESPVEVPLQGDPQSDPCNQNGTDICVPLRPAFTSWCRGGEESYAIFDAVFLQRDNQAYGRPTVIRGPNGPAAISTSDLTFNTQPGMRLFYGEASDCGRGWEIGYLGVWGMFAEDTATDGAGRLQVPGPLGTPTGVLNGGSVARATVRSSVNSIEANVFSRWCDGGPDRLAGEPWRRCGNYDRGTWDWLAGFRWASLDESALLSFTPADVPGSGLYDVGATSNIFAAQVGGRGRMAWDRWAFESWAKVGLGGTAMSQQQAPIVNSTLQPAFQERPTRSASEGGVGLIGDLNFTLTYRMTETWGLRLGYNMLWLSGVAMAPNQFDFSAAPGGGNNLNGGSSIYLAGANLGLEARW